MSERIVCQLTNSLGKAMESGSGVSYSRPSFIGLYLGQSPFLIAIGILSPSPSRENGPFVVSDVTFVIRLRASLSLGRGTH
jgi:hypothetical protein